MLVVVQGCIETNDLESQPANAYLVCNMWHNSDLAHNQIRGHQLQEGMAL